MDPLQPILRHSQSLSWRVLTKGSDFIEDTWTFGQVIALLMVILPLMAITEIHSGGFLTSTLSIG